MKQWKESLGQGLAAQLLIASSVRKRGVVNMGTISNLFDTVDPGENSGGMSLETAKQIVQSYCDCQETSGPFPGCIADARQLPYYKAAIKDALTVCIRASEDPDVTTRLKQGYLQLGAWQDDVGENPIGVDFTRINLESDPMKIARLIQQKFTEMEKWRPLVEAEQRLLKRELNRFGM